MAGDETFNCSTTEKTDILISESFEVTLLREVRRAKSLYCSHDPDYCNMGKRRLEWLLIAEKCKKTVSECVRKWHSLLRIYFSSPENIWMHIEEFRKFEPYLSNHKLQVPNKDQKSQLLRKLLYNSNDLQNPQLTLEERENIWLKIVSKCNAVTPGVIMSSQNWQKWWFMLKQSFGARLYMPKPRNYQEHAILNNKYTEEEIQILEICWVSPWDSVPKILAALGSNLELGKSKKNIILRCKKCEEQKNEILYYGCCLNCCDKRTFCQICEVTALLVHYKLSYWSNEALELLPFKLRSSEEISVCSECSDELNKKATLAWKICRVCEFNNNSPLDSLYCEDNDNFRKYFKDLTRVEFNEIDGLPGYICKHCKEQIIKFNDFATNFKRTQKKLLQIHYKRFIGQTTNKLVEQHKPAEAATKLSAEPRKVKNCSIRNKVVPFNIIPGQEHEFCKMKIVTVQKLGSNNRPDTPTVLCATEPQKQAIKQIFSLKRNNQQKSIQSSSNVIPVPPSQSAKVDSNRILNGTIAVSKTLQSIPKLNDNAQAVALGTVNTYPEENTINTKTTPQSVFRMVKPQRKFRMILPKPGPNTMIKLKPTTASKPAIFTIPIDTLLPSFEPAPSSIETDYETIEDAPPVFCIPKNVIKTENSPSDADKQLIDFAPNPSQVIKIENTNDYDNDYPDIEIPIATSNVPILKTTQKPESQLAEDYANESSILEPEIKTKVFQIKGDLVTVKPHPYLLGAFLPVDTNKNEQMKKTCGLNRLKLPVMRNVNNNNNSIHIAKPIIISPNTPPNRNQSPSEIPPKKPKISNRRKQQAKGKPQKINNNSNNNNKNNSNNNNNNNNTIHIAKPITISMNTTPNRNQDIHNNCRRGRASLLQSPSEIQIKEEILYKDDTNDNVASNKNYNSSFDCNTSKNRTLIENLKLTTPFKPKKLRIDIKRDKRVKIIASKSKKLSFMQSIKESHPVSYAKPVKYRRIRVSNCK